MITLKTVTITYTHKEKFDIEDFVEYCDDQGITVSQKNYLEWAYMTMEDSIRDNINIDDFRIAYSEPKKIKLKERKQNVNTELNNEFVEYEIDIEKRCFDCVKELSDEEIVVFHELCKSDKLIVNLSEGSIIILEFIDNNPLYYGVIIDENNNILKVNNSLDKYCLLKKLKEFKPV